MTNFAGKLPYVQNLASAVDWRYASNNQQVGWELPCIVKAVSADGLYVTVSFAIQPIPYQIPEITVPIFESEYVRIPIQVGTRGYTQFVTVTTENLIKAKAANSDFRNLGNLNKILIFNPISNEGWPINPNINALWLYGPEGVTIQDLHDGESNSKISITATGVRMESGTSYIQINKDGSIVIKGSSVTIMDKDFLTHHHSGVSTGSSNTGNVV